MRLISSSDLRPKERQLTCMEMKVLRLLTKGLTRKEISQRLGVSTHTVNTHIENIYRQLDVHNVAEAVAKAMEKNLLADCDVDQRVGEPEASVI